MSASFKCVVFDLDGVITKTAVVHSKAWKQMFDQFLQADATSSGKQFVEFRHHEDYIPYVDGKPRYKGVQSFLESRGINLEFGDPSDGPDANTCCGLGNRKDKFFNEILDRDGVEVYQSTVDFLKEIKGLGIRVGVASSSKNCEKILKACNLLQEFETRVDGVVSAEMKLKGKPEPDIFTVATDNLECEVEDTIVVEDAVSGVQAGRAGKFGLTLGIAREDNAAQLKENGADIVVDDMSEITIAKINEWFDELAKEDYWRLTYKDYDPVKERTREAMTAVGNGVFGTRGAHEEMDANKVNYPGTYMTGLFNKIPSIVGDRQIMNEDFVNAPNWLVCRWCVDGEWFDINDTTFKYYKKQINMKTGVLTKRMIVKMKNGKEVEINSKRTGSMKDPNSAVLMYALKPLNFSGKVTFRTGLNGRIKNEGVDRYNTLSQQHLEPVDQGLCCDAAFVEVRTTQSKIRIVEAERLVTCYKKQTLTPGQNLATNVEILPGAVYRQWDMDLEQNETYHIVKFVSILNSKVTDGDLLPVALETVRKNRCPCIMMDESAKEWEKVWAKCDVQVGGDKFAQQLLRLHAFHLLVTWSHHSKDIDFGIPARGLHGEAYRGHIFWDELYILPYYNYYFPESAKATLMYRYRRMEEAKKLAKSYGFEGAMFPWQSGSTGVEETQVVHLNPMDGSWGDDYSCLQRHVNLAILYNIWQYYELTGDRQFMADNGAELFFEICRFWASKCELGEDGRYHIHRVMGPDEYHECPPGTHGVGGLSDNAYTNLMVCWCLEKAFEIKNNVLTAEEYSDMLRKVILKPEELQKWEDVSNKMFLSINSDGVIEQFAGYFTLPELDWEYYRGKYGNIARLDRILKAEKTSPDLYKSAKQADTLMTFYNMPEDDVKRVMRKLGYEPHEQLLKVNFEYYLPRTSHGSTLSRVVHSYLANYFGDKKTAWDLYIEALTSDYVDIQGGTTQEGIHTGVMGATLLLAMKSYAGLVITGGSKVEVGKCLPEQWTSLDFKLQVRDGKQYQCHVTHEEATVTEGKWW